MISEENPNSLPPLTTGPLPLVPPIAFNDMSVRCFPLRANLDALQQLCNGYLNIIPPEVGRFRASMPYVYMSVLDYGQVSVDVLGWFAQIEVFFSVPVEWYKVINGRWVFHDWGVITPYIYVNDDFSVPLGRQVYGFPKTLAKIVASEDSWVTDVNAPITLAKVETAIFPELFEGRQLESRTFLEIERAAPMSNLQLPPDAAPWSVMSNFANAASGFGRDAMWMAQAMRIFPTDPMSAPNFAPEMMQHFLPSLDLRNPGLPTNSLNLKQFRDSENPLEICYQGLTNGPMQTTAVEAGGLLGEERMAIGDFSGGYRIKLHEYKTLPMVRALGLEVDRQTRSESGTPVAELAPVMPFWLDINVRYDQGETLAWRGAEGIWKDQAGNVLSTPKSSKPGFCSTLATAVDQIAGPFRYADTTMRVLPLMARRNKMQAYVDGVINDAFGTAIEKSADATDAANNGDLRLRVWSRPTISTDLPDPGVDLAYVYMLATSYSSVTSTTNNVGDWANSELSFMIPIKLERNDGEHWQVEGVGLVPAFNFVDGSIAAAARNEVQGIPTLTANFIKPPVEWLGDREDPHKAMQSLLKIEGEIIPAFGQGQKTEMRTFVDLMQNFYDEAVSFGTEPVESDHNAARWAHYLRYDLRTKKKTKADFSNECKVARTLSMELLGNRMPFSLYSLKQIRDVAQPNKACYQSLQRTQRIIHELLDIREIEETLELRIRDFPSLNMVDQLGILSTEMVDSEAGVEHQVFPVRPFFIRATMDEPLSQSVAKREGNNAWHCNDELFNSSVLNSSLDKMRLIQAQGSHETLQDKADPSNIPMVLRRKDPNASPSTSLSRNDALKALEHVDVQMITEFILSREWGNNDKNARWRRGYQYLRRTYGSLLPGSTNKHAADAEKDWYLHANDTMTGRPGNPSADYHKAGTLGNDVVRLLDMLHSFTNMRRSMEKHFDILGAEAIFRARGYRYLDADGEEKIRKTISIKELSKHIDGLVDELNDIAEKELEIGLVSKHDVQSDRSRLFELLNTLSPNPDASLEEQVELAWIKLETYREAVELARRRCDAQREVVLNVMARAYQKPDFCINRKAFGPWREKLLPETLSWDEHWYFGRQSEQSK